MMEARAYREGFNVISWMTNKVEPSLRRRAAIQPGWRFSNAVGQSTDMIFSIFNSEDIRATLAHG